MLTPADDFAIHQIPEPIAATASERNFYDRYFFNGYREDGSLFFAVALGVYPNLGVMDASLSVVSDGVQRNLHSSKRAPLLDRMTTAVGPIRVDVERPLERLRIQISSPEHSLEADLLFTARCPAIEEPRFTRRQGGRLFMDYTRLTQNGTWTGSLEVNGQEIPIDPEVMGTRDRSWGIRPVGAADSQPANIESQFFWLWAPLNFPSCSTFFHCNADGDGRPWNQFASIQPSNGMPLSTEQLDYQIELIEGTRHINRLTLDFEACPTGGTSESFRIEMKRRFEFFMVGLGYRHPVWGHGLDHGELEVGYDEMDVETPDLNQPLNLHVQALCDVTLTTEGGGTESGIGVLEQLILGRFAPLGLEALIGPE